ncbi:MAG: amino acid transporter substrate-binding protein [Frankiales bacterium]|nr:amino acid transporter substrate-binding protein [Frankiales bacterium]
MNVSKSVMSVAAIAVAAITISACGADNSKSNDTGAASTGSADKGTVVLGSANFGESDIIASIYSQELQKAGYKTQLKSKIGTREVYIKSLEAGEIQVVPEYVGTLTEYYNGVVNGAAAATSKPLATTDATTTAAALKTLITPRKLVSGPPSPAADQNAFAVTQDFATKNNLKTLSDLVKLNGQIVLGAGPECPTRPFCEPGLQKTYGLKFKSFKKLDDDGPQTLGALKSGDIQLGLVFSSDGAVAANNLLVLDDDKKLQQADNIVYLARDSVPADALSVLDKVNAALTTVDLQNLNKQYSVDKADAADLATDWVGQHPLS